MGTMWRSSDCGVQEGARAEAGVGQGGGEEDLRCEGAGGHGAAR